MGFRANLLCNKQIATNQKYRENYDRTFGKRDELSSEEVKGSSLPISDDRDTGSRNLGASGGREGG
jgi:hypothetical protein